MMRRSRSWWVVALAGVAVLSCKKDQTAPAETPADSVLKTALYVQGGAAKVKRGSAFSARYEGTLLGAKITGTMKHKPGAVRLEYLDAISKNPVVQVAATDSCWQQIGRVVVPCHAELAAHSQRLAKLLAASWLYPLQEGSYKHTVGPAELDGKPCHGLTIAEQGKPLGVLLVDKSSSVVLGLKMQTALGGKSGELVGKFTDVEEHCGLQVPTTRQYTLGDATLASEKIAGVICEAPEDEVFAKPPQVPHGTVEIRHTFDAPLACTKLRGPLAGVGGAMQKLVDYLAQQSLAPEGAARLFHKQGPPQLKNPDKYETHVCFPVSRQAWVKPKSVWQGEFFLDQIVGDEILAGFAVGDIEQTTPELAAKLVLEAKKKGRSQAGALVQIVYMPAALYPAAERVSELHLPLN